MDWLHSACQPNGIAGHVSATPLDTGWLTHWHSNEFWLWKRGAAFSAGGPTGGGRTLVPSSATADRGNPIKDAEGTMSLRGLGYRRIPQCAAPMRDRTAAQAWSKFRSEGQARRAQAARGPETPRSCRDRASFYRPPLHGSGSGGLTNDTAKRDAAAAGRNSTAGDNFHQARSIGRRASVCRVLGSAA